jgi:hypothetical protein
MKVRELHLDGVCEEIFCSLFVFGVVERDRDQVSGCAPLACGAPSNGLDALFVFLASDVSSARGATNHGR